METTSFPHTIPSIKTRTIWREKFHLLQKNWNRCDDWICYHHSKSLSRTLSRAEEPEKLAKLGLAWGSRNRPENLARFLHYVMVGTREGYGFERWSALC